MKKIILLMKSLTLLLIMTPLVSVAATVYKVVDEDGNISFSDKPSPQAKIIEVKKAPVISMPDVELPEGQAAEEETEITYQTLLINKPDNDQTIRDNTGSLDIVLALEPALKQQHKIRLSLDGKQVATVDLLNLKLNNIDRGTHEIVAEVIDEESQVVISSEAVTFHMHRFSQLFNQQNNGGQNNGAVSPTNPPRGTPPAGPAPGSGPAASSL